MPGVSEADGVSLVPAECETNCYREWPRTNKRSKDQCHLHWIALVRVGRTCSGLFSAVHKGVRNKEKYGSVVHAHFVKMRQDRQEARPVFSHTFFVYLLNVFRS